MQVDGIEPPTPEGWDLQSHATNQQLTLPAYTGTPALRQPFGIALRGSPFIPVMFHLMDLLTTLLSIFAERSTISTGQVVKLLMMVVTRKRLGPTGPRYTRLIAGLRRHAAPFSL